MTPDSAVDRLATLRSYLDADPENASLLRDTAEAALAADRQDEALALLDRLGNQRDLDPGERNLRGIAAMRSGNPDQAIADFEALREEGEGDPALDFNLAWSLSLAGRLEEAEALLSEEAVASLPQAAMLQVQLAHQAGRFDEAVALGLKHLDTHPGYEPLLASVSVLAMDVEDEALARRCAEASQGHPDGQTTLGLLLLSENRGDEAKALFGRAIATQAKSPRALIGLGLANLASGDPAKAGRYLDQGAEMFGTHLGSWIASGWAHLLAGDPASARARFEQAMAVDSSFAETHGSLAVLDILDGHIEEGERKCETALRLDRQCFSAAFAQTLIAAGEGDQERATRIFELAMRQPLAGSERTLAEAIARMAL